MLACNRLCIDPCDGSLVAEYRIENGYVESRTLETVAECRYYNRPAVATCDT
jgi:hypothetical protein